MGARQESPLLWAQGPSLGLRVGAVSLSPLGLASALFLAMLFLHPLHRSLWEEGAKVDVLSQGKAGSAA